MKKTKKRSTEGNPLYIALSFKPLTAFLYMGNIFIYNGCCLATFLYCKFKNSGQSPCDTNHVFLKCENWWDQLSPSWQHVLLPTPSLSKNRQRGGALVELNEVNETDTPCHDSRFCLVFFVFWFFMPCPFKFFLWSALCLPLSVCLVPSWSAPLCSSPSLTHLASSLLSLLTCSSSGNQCRCS